MILYSSHSSSIDSSAYDGSRELRRILELEKLQKLLKIKPVKVIYNNPATIVIWSDGTKTVAKCEKGDEYNKEIGLAWCIMKRIMGNKQVRKIFKDFCWDNNALEE